MKRLLVALSVLGVVAIASWTYDINYRTKTALREVDRLRAEIAARHETHQVLRIEWAYLNAPDRLRRLVEVHDDRLALVPIGPERFGDVAAVPAPPPPELDPLEAALAAAAAAGAFIPSEHPAPLASVSAEAAAAERLDGGAAFFPVGLAERVATGRTAGAAAALAAAVPVAADTPALIASDTLAPVEADTPTPVAAAGAAATSVDGDAGAARAAVEAAPMLPLEIAAVSAPPVPLPPRRPEVRQ